MNEVLQDIDRWRASGEPVGLATVIQTWGSAPRKAGAKMALTPSGEISGSVSGGCVEGAVFDETVAALEAGRGKLLQYGVADETAWGVGLACGGSIRIFVEPLDGPLYEAIHRLLDEDRLGAIGTAVAGPDPARVGRKFVLDEAGFVDGWRESEAINAAMTLMQAGKSGQALLADGTELFVEVLLPAPQLIMVGGVHIAIALTEIARVLGYRTVVIDPRRAFGSANRFSHADQLITRWPREAFADLRLNQNTAVTLLTHDPKIDDPALDVVLRSPAFYIGALGSGKTHAKRVKRLQDAGFTSEAIGRIHGPIGLDINAQTPEEIAVAIMGEIIAARRQ